MAWDALEPDLYALRALKAEEWVAWVITRTPITGRHVARWAHGNDSGDGKGSVLIGNAGSELSLLTCYRHNGSPL